MASRSFTVETRGQAVVIFGAQNSLISPLILDLLTKGVHAAQINSVDELQNLRKNYDPDYLVIFLDAKTKEWLKGVGRELLPVLQTLIDTGESRLITISHNDFICDDFPLTPVGKKLNYSDYIGLNGYVSAVLSAWLADLKINQSLIVPGDGLEELSLLGENDLVHLLATAVLSPTLEVGEPIYLGNPTPISLLNLAYLVRTNLPFKVDLTFDQIDNPRLGMFDSSTYESTLNRLGYNLSDSIVDFIKSYLKSHVKKGEGIPPSPVIVRESQVKTPPIPPLKKLTPLKSFQPVFVPLQSTKPKFSPPPFQWNTRPKYSGPPRLRTIVGRGLVIALALYLGTIAFSATIAGLSLSQIISSLKSNDLPSTNKLNNLAVTYLRANWIAITSIPGLSKNPSVIDLNILLDAYSQSLVVFATAESLNQSTKDLTTYIFGNGSSNVAQVVSQSRLQAEELYQKLSLLDGALPADPPTIIPSKHKVQYKAVKTKLTKTKRTVTTAKALLATAPDVIGLGGRRKYAVLFQNNMELRATGGFIGSFAVLSFENGKLYDMPIFDVYDADGQLKGHVEPPRPIKDILGEANWYLRDSNFDPDFPTSARRAEWFIKKSLNQDLDGTIAINVNTLVSLLDATGPLAVPDYNETITGSNLYERAQFHAEVNFFPGSTQKKEFLSTVANTLFARLPSLESGEGIKLVSALADSIQAKNTLISFTSGPTEHVFQTLGWNGALNDFPCPTEGNCHKDYAMVVDSNFGVNKANYFIKRNIEEVITFDKDLKVDHLMKIQYQNTSTSSAWPAGIYKNYSRLYLPIGTTIGSVKVGERVLSSKEYSITEEHDKFMLAYLVSVPINSNLTVEVGYSTPQLAQEKSLLYTWYWQKQPGTSSSDTVSVYLNYPMYLRPLIISPTAVLTPQQLKFGLVNDTDHRVTVKFTK